MMDEEEYNRILSQAIRDRILSEVRKPRDVEKIVNNVYGGPLTAEKNQGLGGGVMGEMARDMTPEELDYYVSISREDMDELNPLTGKPKGWNKKVRRFTLPKGSPNPFENNPGPGPEGQKKKVETIPISKEQFEQAAKDDIDPAKYAGESWYATDEYARPDDIDNPYTRGEVGKEGDYYPPPAPPRKYSKKVQKIKERMEKERKTLAERMMEDGKI